MSQQDEANDAALKVRRDIAAWLIAASSIAMANGGGYAWGWLLFEALKMRDEKSWSAQTASTLSAQDFADWRATSRG
jgi:hypothetical protein